MIERKNISCRQAATRSRLGDFCLNPYAGCAHACRYCYARYMRDYHGPGAPDWGTYVYARVNFADVFLREVRRLPVGSTLMLSSVTDAWQPAEAEYGLTRRVLEILAAVPGQFKVHCLTKGVIASRDLALLATLGPSASLGVSLTTLDADLARWLEPRAASPAQRLDLLTAANHAGIATWVFMAPLIPGLTATSANLAPLVAAIRAAGTADLQHDLLNPRNHVGHDLWRAMCAEQRGDPAALRAYLDHPDRERPALDQLATRVSH